MYLMGDDYIVKATGVGNKNTMVEEYWPSTIDMQVALFETKQGRGIKICRSQVTPRPEPHTVYYSVYGTKGFLENNRHGKDVVGMRYFEGNTPVSMNMWAFTPDILDRLEKRFIAFLADGGLETPNSEFLIPTEVGHMLQDGVCVKVLPTPDQWFGMTFSEELPMVREAMQKMTDEGKYPTPLFA